MLIYKKSVNEATATQKFPQNGSRRYLFFGDIAEEREEFEQRPRRGVFGAGFWHVAQQRFGMGFEYAEFKQQGRIEHDVGVFLIGEDVFVLALYHAVPASECVQGRIAAEVVVAYMEHLHQILDMYLESWEKMYNVSRQDTTPSLRFARVLD